VRALALDFDGVISDSAREAFEVALRTFARLRPSARLAALAERPEAEAQPALFAAFLALMPLGNRAEDYGVILAALEAGGSLPDQAAYDAFHAAQDPAWLGAYHERFYEERAAFAERDRAGWLARMAPYAPFVATLRRRAGDAVLAIATAKDHRSVSELLRAYGLADLFEPRWILDKEAGVSKRAHLERLAAGLRLPFKEITFLDDKVNHLESVAPLGVRCALAAWGYNGERERDRARALGFLVCRLEDVEAQLFGNAPARAPREVR
jgi:phosphoglycolate phosphatase-like HAD superfamily hydrolase